MNIPVFGEVVFNCDRRIWQTILFEKVFYQWQYEDVNSARIYCYFAGCREGLLNQKFVYIGKEGKGQISTRGRSSPLCDRRVSGAFVSTRVYRYSLLFLPALWNESRNHAQFIKAAEKKLCDLLRKVADEFSRHQ